MSTPLETKALVKENVELKARLKVLEELLQEQEQKSALLEAKLREAPLPKEAKKDEASAVEMLVAAEQQGKHFEEGELPLEEAKQKWLEEYKRTKPQK